MCRHPFEWGLHEWNDEEVTVGQLFLSRWKTIQEWSDGETFPLPVCEWLKAKFEADMATFFYDVCLDGTINIHVEADFRKLLMQYLFFQHAAQEDEFNLRMKNFIGSFVDVHRHVRVHCFLCAIVWVNNLKFNVLTRCLCVAYE